MNPTQSAFRAAVAGALTLAILALIIRLCIGLFTLEFEDSRTVTLRADRAGLLLETNAAVKYHGIDVGRVSRITLRPGGADVALAMKPDQLRKIPANVAASIVPTTLLGSKFVELRDTEPRAQARLAPRSVIAPIHNTAELNVTFDHLADVLSALKPAEVSNVLHGLNAALDGNGDEVEAILDDLETIVPAVNRQAGQIEEVLQSAPAVADGYANLTDPLADTLTNAGELSELLDSRATEFSDLLESLTVAGLDIEQNLRLVAPGLTAAVATLLPTLQLLDRFRDLVPCLLRGHEEFGERARAVFGGPNKGGTHRNGHITLTMVRGQPPYEYPKNLPKVAAKGEPNCHGLPLPASAQPFVSYDVGANPYPNVTDETELSLGILLFGDQLTILDGP